MSIVKQFSLSSSFRSAVKNHTKHYAPSDLLYTFGAALYERSNKSRQYSEKEFYRKAVTRIMQTAKNLKALEGQYYG